MRTLALAALSTLLMTLQANAGDDNATPSAPAAQQTSATNDSNDKVCAYYYYEGTIIRKPVCKSSLAWQAEKKRGQQEFRNFQMYSLTTRM